MNSFSTDIEPCLETLRNGGLILYPTDTIWGIGCDATDPVAVEKVYALKQRRAENALIALVADERDILQYVAAVDLGLFDHLDKQARPTTVIYDGAVGLADNLVADDGSVGIRICKDDFCRTLLRRFRKPIVSTSANISGEPSPGNFHDVSNAIIAGVDYTVRYRQDDRTKSQSSSIIRWKNGTVTVLRP